MKENELEQNKQSKKLQEVLNSLLLVKQGLQGIYMTLPQVDIKATPNNTKYFFGVYSEVEKLLQITERIQEIGGEENVEREGE